MISIGMLAYNEARLIERTLDSLLRQALFTAAPPPERAIELIVVANGCTDATASIARRTLDRLVGGTLRQHVAWRVAEIARPGKCHAWNRFVHELASPAARRMIVLDADIELVAPDTLGALLRLLDARPEVAVAVDEPIKDTTLTRGGPLARRISARLGRLSGRRGVPGEPSWLCGQLYAARAETLRRIRLPDDFAGPDDSLLYDLVVTDGLRRPPEPGRVVLAADAAHVFEAYATLLGVLRHERWLIAGMIAKEMLIDDVRAAMRATGEDAASIVARRDATEPGWLVALLARQCAARGWWLVPGHVTARRFRALAAMAWPRRLALAPLAAAATAADLAAAVAANAQVRRRGALAASGKH